MQDGNKNIPQSAGDAAEAIANEDKKVEQEVRSVERNTYEDSKKIATAVSAGSKGGSAWKVATVVFAVLALGASVACFYFATTKGGDASDASQTKCVEAKDDVKDAEKGETPDIADSTTDDFVVDFYKSGLKLNLGSGFEFINLSYSASSSYDENYVERIAIGGLSKNTTGAQNIPDFARGEQEAFGTDEHSWLPLAIIKVYTREYWDANIQPGIDDAKANGVATSADTWYKDENYAIEFNHPQGVVSPEGWERDWEMATVKALEEAITNTSNWSK